MQLFKKGGKLFHLNFMKIDNKKRSKQSVQEVLF